jgi:hypothetical protein
MNELKKFILSFLLMVSFCLLTAEAEQMTFFVLTKIAGILILAALALHANACNSPGKEKNIFNCMGKD